MRHVYSGQPFNPHQRLAQDSLITESVLPGGGRLYAYRIGKHRDNTRSLIRRWYLLGCISFERFTICRLLATQVRLQKAAHFLLRFDL